MAQMIANTIKGLASKGKTIISVIHQPSSQAFNIFNQLVFFNKIKFSHDFLPISYQKKCNHIGR